MILTCVADVNKGGKSMAECAVRGEVASAYLSCTCGPDDELRCRKKSSLFFVGSAVEP